MERYQFNFLSQQGQSYVKTKNRHDDDFLYKRVFNKPDSVQPKASSTNKPKVVSIINLQNVLPQIVKPSTRFFIGRDITKNPF